MVELNSKLPGIEEKLAYAFRERARLDLEMAARWYYKAIQANPESVKNPQQFLDIKPHHPEIYLHLGNLLLEQNRLDEAISIYQTAIVLFNDHPEVYFYFGKALAQKPDEQQAMAAYQRAVELDPNHAWSHHHIGDILAAKGQFDEAIAS